MNTHQVEKYCRKCKENFNCPAYQAMNFTQMQGCSENRYTSISMLSLFSQYGWKHIKAITKEEGEEILRTYSKLEALNGNIKMDEVKLAENNPQGTANIADDRVLAAVNYFDNEIQNNFKADYGFTAPHKTPTKCKNPVFADHYLHRIAIMKDLHLGSKGDIDENGLKGYVSKLVCTGCGKKFKINKIRGYFHPDTKAV